MSSRNVATDLFSIRFSAFFMSVFNAGCAVHAPVIGAAVACSAGRGAGAALVFEQWFAGNLPAQPLMAEFNRTTQ